MEEQELLWSSSQQELVRGSPAGGAPPLSSLAGPLSLWEVFAPRALLGVQGPPPPPPASAPRSVLAGPPPPPPPGGLSEVQLELLRMLAEGCTDKEIAAQKRVSPSTVRNHRFKLREKERQARLFWP